MAQAGPLTYIVCAKNFLLSPLLILKGILKG